MLSLSSSLSLSLTHTPPAAFRIHLYTYCTSILCTHVLYTSKSINRPYALQPRTIVSRDGAKGRPQLIRAESSRPLRLRLRLPLAHHCLGLDYAATAVRQPEREPS